MSLDFAQWNSAVQRVNNLFLQVGNRREPGWSLARIHVGVCPLVEIPQEVTLPLAPNPGTDSIHIRVAEQQQHVENVCVADFSRQISGHLWFGQVATLRDMSHRDVMFDQQDYFSCFSWR